MLCFGISVRYIKIPFLLFDLSLCFVSPLGLRFAKRKCPCVSYILIQKFHFAVN